EPETGRRSRRAGSRGGPTNRGPASEGSPMNRFTRWRRAALIAGALAALGAASFLAPNLMPKASAAAKTVYIPASWASTGEVPWAQNRTKESANFILLWG